MLEVNIYKKYLRKLFKKYDDDFTNFFLLLCQKKILKSMALSEGSDRFQTWLEPWRMDLDPALTAYAFNITNKDEVLRGKFFLENQNRFVFMTMI